MRKLMKAASVMMILALSLVAVAKDGKMLNIQFEDKSGDGMTMEMSLPLALLESVQPNIEQALQAAREEGHLEMDFAAIWKAVKDAGPTEFVEFNSKDADVKVSTTETHLIVDVREKKDGNDILITIPLALGDALFTDIDNINYDGIVEALLAMEGQDLVKIDGTNMKGRVWIE